MRVEFQSGGRVANRTDVIFDEHGVHSGSEPPGSCQLRYTAVAEQSRRLSGGWRRRIREGCRNIRLAVTSGQNVGQQCWCCAPREKSVGRSLVCRARLASAVGSVLG